MIDSQPKVRFFAVPFPGVVAAIVVGLASVGNAAFDGSRVDDDPEVVHYGIPAVDEVHLDSYADFQDFAESGDWSRAFRSIATQLKEPPTGMLAGKDGIALSWSERLWRDLIGLGPEARRAFRLFHDAKAERMLEDAEAIEDGDERRAALRRIFDSYFLTVVGDDVADRLATLARAEGRWGEAARMRRSILDHHPDTNLERDLLWVRYCEDLAAAGRDDLFAEASDFVVLRYGGRSVDLGNVTVDVEEHLAGLAAQLEALRLEVVSPVLPPSIELPSSPEAAWEVEMSTYEGGTRWGGWGQDDGSRTTLSPSLLHEGVLYINSIGHLLAIDPASGDLLWETGDPPESRSGVVLDGRFSISVAEGWILATGDTVSDDGIPRIKVLCLDPKTGDRRWSTAGDEDWTEVSVIGHPAVQDGRVFAVVQRAGNYALYLWTLDLGTGERLAEIPIGSPGSGAAESMFHTPASEVLPISPSLVLDGAMAYVMTDSGALLAVDLREERIAWGFTYGLTQQMRSSGGSPGTLVSVDGLIVFRSQGSPYVYALDPRSRELLWKRRLPGRSTGTTRVVGAEGGRVFLLDDDLWALDVSTGDVVWKRPVTSVLGTTRLASTEGHLLVLTRRGLFEIEKESGDNARKFRGVFTSFGGGDLLLADGVICCIGKAKAAAIPLAD